MVSVGLSSSYLRCERGGERAGQRAGGHPLVRGTRATRLGDSVITMREGVKGEGGLPRGARRAVNVHKARSDSTRSPPDNLSKAVAGRARGARRGAMAARSPTHRSADRNEQC